MKIQILQKISCTMIILSTETKFFSVALEHFLNNLISKNPVYICFSGSNGLQETSS